jgi:hypothetical protein
MDLSLLARGAVLGLSERVESMLQSHSGNEEELAVGEPECRAPPPGFRPGNHGKSVACTLKCGCNSLLQLPASRVYSG